MSALTETTIEMKPFVMHDGTSVQEVPAGIILPHMPIDEEIKVGAAVERPLVDSSIEIVSVHLRNSLEELRSMAAHPAKDRTKELGRCIAYSTFELASEEVQLLDQTIIDISDQLNHGMKRIDSKYDPGAGVQEIWRGFDPLSRHDFMIFRRVGTLVLFSGELVDRSSIWAAKAKPKLV